MRGRVLFAFLVTLLSNEAWAHVDTGYLACSPESLDSTLYVFLDSSGFTIEIDTADGRLFVCGGATCHHSATTAGDQVQVHFANGAGLAGNVTLDPLLLQPQPVLTSFPSAAQFDTQLASDSQSAPVSRLARSALNCGFGMVSGYDSDSAAAAFRQFIMNGN